MKTANITWELPAKRPFAADLSGVRVFLSADLGANFTDAGVVPAADPQQFVAADLAIGDWIVRLVVEDINGLGSSGVDTQFLVPDEAAPDDVINVAVALT
jgi:hypothetical protein